jgi:hypothetical protein
VSFYAVCPQLALSEADFSPLFSDITPVNLFPPSYNRKAFQESQWVYDVHYNAWKDWMNSSQTNRSIFVDQVGCYSVEEPDMRLRFISL